MREYRAQRVADGLARVLRTGYRGDEDVALWSRRPLRKWRTCAATGKRLDVGALAYGPVGNQQYRSERIDAALVDSLPLHVPGVYLDPPAPEEPAVTTPEPATATATAPAAAEPAVPPANGVECYDCPGFGNYFKTTTEECPYDLDHVVSPIYVSDVPLGRRDDDEVRVGTRDLWAYEVEQ